MKKALLLFLCGALLVGCGPYRVTYEMPSDEEGKERYEQIRLHSHAIGPLLIGGGLLFFVFSPMSPALVNYTGVVDARKVCPEGFVDVSHYHDPWQHMVGALVSWVGILNWWHPSYADWTCIRERQPF